MSDDPDYLVALEMQKRWNAESNIDLSSSGSDAEIVNFEMPPPSMRPLRASNINSKYTSNKDEDYLNRTQNLVHPLWETLDPTPDIFALFSAFDDKFFQSRLKCVTLEWSKRMYSCAGICYSRRNRLGMDVTIRLSEPLLRLRPRKDLVETMLHEMIHAYCFVLNIREGNGGHGPNFKKIMYAINKVAGTNITVYHTFYDEVDIYKQHWWRCNGSCQNRAPFFGYVKRTSNRAPSANDQWWAAHQESCGGTFMKIKEPEKPKRQKSTKEVKANGVTDLHKFFPTISKSSTTITSADSSSKKNGFSGSGFKGPIKANGGNTLLLNPQTKRNTTTMNSNTNEKQPSIANAFPPTSYPGLSKDPFNMNVRSSSTSIGSPIRFNTNAGNLRNVVGFADLSSGGGGAVRKSDAGRTSAAFVGSGCQLNSNNTMKNSSPGDEVDRKHLRDMWSKRFGNNSNSNESDKKSDHLRNSTKSARALECDAEVLTGDAKRRRLSCESDAKDDDEIAAVDAVAKPNAQNNAWLVLDDDVMLREQPTETIAISSDEDDDDDDERKVETVRTTSTLSKTLTTDERQTIIKKEILDDTEDLLDEDIILIDDEYNDDASDNDELNISAAVELADSSVIDEFFGDDILLKEFKRENDVVPTFSRNIPNPSDDIITCPVCQGKMKRCLFAEHMDGCTGIAVKVVLPKHTLKKLSSTSRVMKPTNRVRTSRKSVKDILRNAGYTEQDLLNITSPSSTEDERSFSSANTTSQPTSPNANSTVIEVSPEKTNTSRKNNKNATVACPNCQQQIESANINEHLDGCLSS